MRRHGMIGLRSYQDIKTPEEIEEEREREYLKRMEREEREMEMAEMEHEERMIREHEED